MTNVNYKKGLSYLRRELKELESLLRKSKFREFILVKEFVNGVLVTRSERVSLSSDILSEKNKLLKLRQELRRERDLLKENYDSNRIKGIIKLHEENLTDLRSQGLRKALSDYPIGSRTLTSWLKENEGG